ncbi:hypothetical protein HYC85_013370 [Camellia sinensis]|uniref:Uncharacterized protein n=1 Tax=Camellia sinensis TaxID=4442 RepID=A0A7J7H363_CAMSI|nr:hypothetical protein HYC85_013370 [Camellia sinensis]
MIGKRSKNPLESYTPYFLSDSLLVQMQNKMCNSPGQPQTNKVIIKITSIHNKNKKEPTSHKKEKENTYAHIKFHELSKIAHS